MLELCFLPPLNLYINAIDNVAHVIICVNTIFIEFFCFSIWFEKKNVEF